MPPQLYSNPVFSARQARNMHCTATKVGSCVDFRLLRQLTFVKVAQLPVNTELVSACDAFCAA